MQFIYNLRNPRLGYPRIVPYRGEWNLQKALKFENSIGRNKVAHSNEVVYQTMHWWDDGVFEEFPTWFDCINNVERAQYLLSPNELEFYFGSQDGGGPGNYAQCVKYGIGENVLAKMLGDAVSLTEIRESLTSQEVTARRKRGLELKAAEERAKAKAERAEAEHPTWFECIESEDRAINFNSSDLESPGMFKRNSD